jgi:hypothetical protein
MRHAIWAPVTLVLGLAACGSDAADPANDAANDAGNDQSSSANSVTCTTDETVCIGVNLPANYAGTADRFFVGLYAALPPAGPPEEMLPAVESPTVTAGKLNRFKFEDVTAEGDYFVYAVLYDEEGGEFQPLAGVDYIATSDSAITFDGGPTDVGTLDLVVAAE